MNKKVKIKKKFFRRGFKQKVSAEYQSDLFLSVVLSSRYQ